MMSEARDMASPEADEKTLPMLLKELRERNEENLVFLAKIDKLERILAKINTSYARPSTLLPGVPEFRELNEKPIRDWKKTEISTWASEIRRRKYREEVLPEILAVIKRAVFCSENILPRDVQILSVLSLLYSKDGHGRLAQIYTGEGKSITISVLAVVKVLQGNKVDIVTSSEVLAQRDAEDRAKFYELFGLSTAENCSGAQLMKNPCYRADIVYGDTLNFQGDILTDEYKQWGTRYGRPFNVVIVDEVDSMLIDERLCMTRLSSPTPGMSALTPVLEFIWILTNKCYDLVVRNKDGEFKSIDPVVLVKLHLKDNIKKIKEFVEASIPQYFKEYAVTQVINWCFSAVHAILSYKEKEHYVVRDGEIVPVDFKNTGVYQYRMHWGDGLHQFLQMKHDLKVTQINLVTNFLSNVSYFKRYGANIFGLTGTLGSESERKLLTDLYSLDSVYIPSYRPRRLQEVHGIILRDHVSWLSSIKENITRETTKGRAVLVICETIQKVLELQTRLSDDDDGKLISIYIENSIEEQQIIRGRLLPRQVVLATNLAGRGTDLKISSDLERNGGLHVIVTFLPENLRVQEQAFGRAGRQGSAGTAQLIINVNDESIRGKYSKYQTLDEIKAARDAKEKIYLASAAKETEKVVNKDKLFREFCLLMERIKKSSKGDKEVLDALEERWALWLLSLTDKTLLTQEHTKLFEGFKVEILKDDLKNEIIKNPKYYLRQGHKFLEAKKYDEALKAYRIAERMNAFDWLPKYYQAIAIIKLQEQIGKPDMCTLKEGIELLEGVRGLCADEIARYEGVQQYYQLQRTTIAEKPREQQSLDIDTRPIHDLTTTVAKCDRYDQLLQVKSRVLTGIDKLIVDANKALEDREVLKIEINEADSIFNSKDEKEIIENLRAEGLSKIASIDKPIPWLPILFTGLSGISELVLGIVLCSTGVGTLWGYGFIIQGSSDITTAIITYTTKDFNWKIYVAAKAATMALTIFSVPFINVGTRVLSEVGVARIGAAVGAGGVVYGAIRSGIDHYISKAGIRKILERIIKSTGLKDKIDHIKEIMEQFSSDNPVYREEFDSFEQSCIGKITEVVHSKPISDILTYLTFIPNSEGIVKSTYTKVNETHLDSIITAALEDARIAEEVVGAGGEAFILIQEGRVAENIIDKLSEELRIPELDFYTPETLVKTIALLLLTGERKELDASITKARDEKAALQSRKENLEKQRKAEHDDKKIKDLKLLILDAREDIESVEEKIAQLENTGREFNQKAEAITEIDPAAIIPVIESLNGNVFRVEDGVPFVVLEANVDNAKEIIRGISVDCSLEILKTLFIETFNHIYDVSSRKDSMQVLPNLVVKMSKTGNGSLIHSFFEKYLSKIAAAHNLDIQKTVELAKLNIDKINKEQEEEMSANISDIIGTKQIIPADGNCFFAAVAATFGLAEDYHRVLRRIAINHIIRNEEYYEEVIVDSSFKEYIRIYREHGIWNATGDGNDIMIAALAEALNLSIVIHDEQHGGITHTINDQETLPEIHLAFTGAHYNAYVSRDLTYLHEVQEIVLAFDEEPLHGSVNQPMDVGLINSYFSLYTMSGIKRILILRTNDKKIKNVRIAGGYVFAEDYTNISNIFAELTMRKSEILLVPLSLYNKHAVGLMFVKQIDGNLKVYYLDPENERIPEGLKQTFASHSYAVEQLRVEYQSYTNCGPEVIENFMLYLTGERLSQKDAIVYNSRLIEQELIANSGNKHRSKALNGSYCMHSFAKQYISQCEFTHEVDNAQDNSVMELLREEEIRVIDSTFGQSTAILASSQERAPSNVEQVITNNNVGDRLHLIVTELVEEGLLQYLKEVLP